MPRDFVVRTADVIREKDPDIPRFWNIADLVVEFAKRDYTMVHWRIADAIMRGHGPAIVGTCGDAILIEPEEGLRWVEQVTAQRKRARQEKMKQKTYGEIAVSA